MATKSNITPLFDNVLVKPVKAETTTASGIILPDSAKEKPQIAEVVAVGTGVYDQNGKLIPLIVKVGQKVLCSKWGGSEVKVGNEEWKLVKQSDILAIVN